MIFQLFLNAGGYNLIYCQSYPCLWFDSPTATKLLFSGWILCGSFVLYSLPVQFVYRYSLVCCSQKLSNIAYLCMLGLGFMVSAVFAILSYPDIYTQEEMENLA